MAEGLHIEKAPKFKDDEPSTLGLSVVDCVSLTGF